MQIKEYLHFEWPEKSRKWRRRKKESKRTRANSETGIAQWRSPNPRASHENISDRLALEGKGLKQTQTHHHFWDRIRGSTRDEVKPQGRNSLTDYSTAAQTQLSGSSQWYLISEDWTSILLILTNPQLKLLSMWVSRCSWVSSHLPKTCRGDSKLPQV